MGAFTQFMFSGTPGTALDGYAEDLGTLHKHANYSGTACVISADHRARANTTSTSVVYADATPPSADYDVEAEVYVAGLAGEAGVLGRVNTAAATYYMARVSGGNWQLFRIVSNSATQLGPNVPTGLSAGQTAKLRLSMVGTAISVYVNNAVVIGPATDSGITAAGVAGMRMATASDTNGYHLDNLQAGTDLAPIGGSSGASSRLWRPSRLKGLVAA